MRSPRRLMCASVLGFECIVLALVTPVLIMVQSISTGAALATGLGLAAAALVIAGLLRYEVMYLAGSALQVAAVLLGFVVPVMFVLGVVFAALWTTAYVLGRRIDEQRAASLRS